MGVNEKWDEPTGGAFRVDSGFFLDEVNGQEVETELDLKDLYIPIFNRLQYA
jgi:hypothetical protein